MRQADILRAAAMRLGIDALNPLQRRVADELCGNHDDALIVAPTGSGKTLAFLLPLLTMVEGGKGCVEAVIVAPTRELVLQIYGVARALAADAKVTAIYGGHSVRDEARSLTEAPAIVVATPGRLVDHLNRKQISLSRTAALVLDEFDKTLELGFEDEARRIAAAVPMRARTILTSATTMPELPPYITLHSVHTIESSDGDATAESRLALRLYRSPEADKLEALRRLLASFGPEERAIVFVNYRDAVARVFDFVSRLGITAGYYHGALQQLDREKVVEMMANGSFSMLVSTDLAARGLDLPQVDHIVHYHLPLNAATFTHRNGRTARVEASGVAHVILGPTEAVPDFIDPALPVTPIAELPDAHPHLSCRTATLFVHAGRKEKISRGDIVGFIVNNSDLSADRIGIINSHDHFTLVAIKDCPDIAGLIATLAQAKLKGKRIRISPA